MLTAAQRSRKRPCGFRVRTGRALSGLALSVVLALCFCTAMGQQPPLPVIRPGVTPQVPRPPPNAPPGVPPAMPPPAGTATPVEGGPGLKFKNSPLELVLKDYAEKTHRTILQAALPAVNVTLESQPNLTQDEYLEAIETVLAMNGIGLLKVGEKFLKVVPIGTARKEAMEINEKADDLPLKENDALVSQMIPLKNIDLKEAVAVITPLKHDYGQINLLERSNSILITDAAATVNRINQLIKYIDLPIEALEEPNIIEIRYAKAADIKRKLEEIIADAKKDAQKSTIPRPADRGQPGVARPTLPTPPGVIRPTPAPTPAKPNDPDLSQLREVERGIIRGEVKIIADERTNILIIITRRENMPFFEKIIKVLDVETAPDVMVLVIRLEYADAEQVASTLNSLVGQAGKGSDVKPPTTTPGGEQKGGESAALREYVDRLQRDREAAAATAAAKEKSKVGELAATNIKILSDKRSNALIIMASKADMSTIQDIIKDMDIMLSQVMIEAVILQVTLDNTADRGVEWVQRSMIAQNRRSSGGQEPIFSFAGSGGTPGSLDTTGPRDATTMSAAVPLSGGLTYYFTHFGLNMDMVLRWAASDTRTKVLSSPVILTTDNKEAKIDVSTERYFYKGQTPTSVGGTIAYVPNVEMRKVGLNLTVTPRINQKKFVVMEIKQKIEEQAGSQEISGQGSWPVISSRELGASVSVRSGETIVLGGLVKDRADDGRTKIPILGDIPLLGIPFRSMHREKAREEVIVFITPYVQDTPEEIAAYAQRRKEAVHSEGLWTKGWSESKLADEPPKKEQKEKRGKGKPKDSTPPVEPPPAASAVPASARPPAVSALPSGMDPERAEFIRQQDEKYDRALKNVDEAVDRQMREGAGAE